MFFNWELQDLVRFLTNDKVCGIFTTDTTYNLGEFYVTSTTYKHLDVTTQKHPTMAGPILVYQRKNFSSLNYVANTLVCFNKQLQHIKVTKKLVTNLYFPQLDKAHITISELKSAL